MIFRHLLDSFLLTGILLGAGGWIQEPRYHLLARAHAEVQTVRAEIASSLNVFGQCADVLGSAAHQ